MTVAVIYRRKQKTKKTKRESKAKKKSEINHQIISEIPNLSLLENRDRKI